MGPALVFGHRNPDNDSICSAVAYAHLKNLTDDTAVYVPARLGQMPPETAWVFERFGVEAPEVISHVRTRVRDVMTPDPITIRANATLRDTGNRMRDHSIRAVPVVDDDGATVGLVSERVLAERYLDEIDVGSFEARPVRVVQLVRAIDGRLVTGDPEASLSGTVRIAAREPETMMAKLQPGDTLIVGDRVRTIPMALEAGVGALVLVDGAEARPEIVELARQKGAAIISTDHRSYSTARLVSLAHTAGEVMEPDVLMLSPETLMSEATEELLGSAHRVGVVAGEDRKPIGIVTRTNLARRERRKVVLVDHNEASQSAEGVEDASVIEIVDHHRIGDIQTHGPIMFLNMPVGATATIVARRFVELGVELTPEIAGILLSAILTDTVLLKSPTATDVDREMVERLAGIVDVDPMEFGMEVFRAKSAGQAFDPKRVVGADLKEYRIGDVRAAIGQYETVDLEAVTDHADEIAEAMEALRVREGYDVVVLMLTDIVREGSAIAATGATRVVERGLDISLADGPVWMPGVLSRKKQVAARLAEAAGA